MTDAVSSGGTAAETGDTTVPPCDQCGKPFETAADGRTFHVGLDGSTDPARDRHHTAYATGTLW